MRSVGAAIYARDVRRVGVVVIVLLAIVSSSTAVAATTPYTSARTAACLAAHSVLTSSIQPAGVLPPQPNPRPVATMTASFAFSAGAAATDTATVWFTKTAPLATRLYRATLTYQYAQATRYHGVPQDELRAEIRKHLLLRGNVLVETSPHIHAASQTKLLACLR
jgi:hypothetical protein